MNTIVDYVLNLSGNLTGKVQEATQHTKQLESTMNGVKTAIGALGIAFGAFQIVSFIKGGTEMFHELEQVTAKVEANLASTGETAGMSLKDIQGFAGALSQKIQSSKTEITDMASQLLTFPAITKDVFQQSMGLVADIAKQTGHELRETAIMYGKALNDPTDGLQKMMRYGVMFSDAEKKRITHLQQTGHLIEAQKSMMEAIAGSGYAGVAEKMFDANPMAKFNKMIGFAKLAVGEYTTEILVKVMPALEAMAGGVKSTAEFLEKHKTAIGYIIGIYAAYKAMMLGIMLIEKSAIAIKAASAVASELLLAWDMARAEGLGILRAAQWALNVAMNANPIGLIIAGVAALIGGVIALSNHFGGFKNMLASVWEMIKAFGMGVVGIFRGVGEAILGVITFNPALVKKGISDAIDAAMEAKDKIAATWNAPEIAEKNKSLLEGKPGAKGKIGAQGEVVTAPKTKAEGQKTINIHVAYNAPLIKEFTISTTNIKEGLGTLKDQVSAILVGATHDSLMVADY